MAEMSGWAAKGGRCTGGLLVVGLVLAVLTLLVPVQAAVSDQGAGLQDRVGVHEVTETTWTGGGDGLTPGSQPGCGDVGCLLVRGSPVAARGTLRGRYWGGRLGRGGTRWQNEAVYRSGQVRAERLVHEAGRATGLDVAALVDDIVYVPHARSPFFDVVAGRRVLGLNRPAVYGESASLRLLKAGHELGHALVHGRGLRMAYALEEVYVESFARTRLSRATGGLPRGVMRNSVRYENGWRARHGLPTIPLPQ
jgi:hypothetical protein